MPTEQFAMERMGVFQVNRACVSLPDMSDDGLGTDRQVFHKPGHRRITAGVDIAELLEAFAVVKTIPKPSR